MAAKHYPQCLLIGDSIIQFASFTHDGFSFGAGLAEHVQRRLDVINRGLSGYNTSHAMVILDHLIPSTSCAKVDYLLILFGANDACLPSSPTKQHVPLDQYRKNLLAIINHPAVKAHSPKILLVTPPPINEAHLEAEDAKKNQALTRHQKVTGQYAEAVREIAEENRNGGVFLVDLWTAILSEASKGNVPLGNEGKDLLLGLKEEGDCESLRKLLVDGLHLTGQGYRVFLDAVLPHIGKEWADESPVEPSWIFPHWSIAPKKD